MLIFYRLALSLQLALVCLGLANPEFLEAKVPEEVQAFLDANPEPSGAMLLVMLVVLVAYGAACIGAIWFWRPSRFLFAAAVVLIVVLNPLLGGSFDTGWKDLLEESSTLLDGVLLALMFCSPLRTRFTAKTA